jgi:LPS O-antigen subunit length determinant protein (WzzB/FepE family)
MLILILGVMIGGMLYVLALVALTDHTRANRGGWTARALRV